MPCCIVLALLLLAQPAFSQDTSPPTSGALRFHAPDRQEVSVGPVTSTGDQYTAEAWIWIAPEAYENGRSVLSVIGQHAAGHDAKGTLDIAHGKLRFLVNTTGHMELRSDADVPVGRWVHVAGTYDGSSMRVYLDGVERGRRSASGLITNETRRATRIGGYAGTSTEPFWFWGDMDEVRIWDIARTAAQLKQDMFREIDVQAGLIGYWRFNEGEGEASTDHSGRGHSGLLTNYRGEGAPLWVESTALEPVALEPIAPRSADSLAGWVTTIVDQAGFIPGSIASPEARIFVDTNGYRFFAEARGHRILRWSPEGELVAVAGTGSGPAEDGKAAINVRLYRPHSPFVAGDGQLYFADSEVHFIYRIDQLGRIWVVAGNGHAGFSGDGGPATEASLSAPGSIFIDQGGNLYLVDGDNHRIRRIDAHGTISTVAGNGEFGTSGDGERAVEARLGSVEGIFVDTQGVLYFAEQDRHRIRTVDLGGVISTVAGNGQAGFSGDGGRATNAHLHNPNSPFVDSRGDLYFADRNNNRIRKVDASGNICTVAGNGSYGFPGDEGDNTPPLTARLGRPESIFVDFRGVLYFAEPVNTRLRTLTGVAAPTRLNEGAFVDDPEYYAIAVEGMNLEIERAFPFQLTPGYPNPFNASTILRYQLSGASLVRLEIFSATGNACGSSYTPGSNPVSIRFPGTVWTATATRNRAVCISFVCRLDALRRWKNCCC